MTIQSKTILKGYFETGDVPTQSQFEDLIDSMASQSIQTTLQTVSTNWDNVFTTVNTASSNWINDDSVNTLVHSNSGNWDGVHTTVNNASSTWVNDDFVNTLVHSNSGNWDSAYTTVNNASSTWGGGGGNPVVTTLTYSPSVTTDLSTGDIFTMTLTGNVTLLNPISGTNGKAYTWMIKQDGSGSHGITLASNFKIPSTATVPLAWSTTANYTDMLAVRNINNVLYVVAMVPGYN